MTISDKRGISVVAAMALASVAGAEGMPPFEEVDRDGDGYISMAEAAEIDGLPELFPILDEDGDGRLTRQEYEAVKDPAEGQDESLKH